MKLLRTQAAPPRRTTRRPLHPALAVIGLMLLWGCTSETPETTPEGPSGAASPATGPATAPATGAPKAVFVISIDTLRQDHVGTYGYERDTTPVLDQLAESSLVFERAYTTASFTLIAHMSLLTGLYPFQHRVLKPNNSLSAQAPTLAERLQGAGYHTMGFYFPGWLDENYGFGRGFDHYQSHRTAQGAQQNLYAALSSAPKDKPIFCFIHLFDVHNAALVRKRKTMYDPPAPYDQMFVSDARERLEKVNPRATWKRDASSVLPDQHEAIVGMYDGGIRYVDTVIGEWVEHLRGLGLFEDSLFIVTSDHGEGLNQRASRYGGHGGAFEEGLLVPLILRLPKGQFGGQRVSGPVSHVDLIPTILDALDHPADDRLPGHSLLAGRPSGSLLYAERPETDTVLDWPWKLTRKSKDGRVLLYNLETDPLEQNDLFGAKASEAIRERVASLQQLVIEERAQRFMPESTSEQVDTRSEDTRELLRDLGYSDD